MPPTPMQKRFQKSRWTPLRKTIAAMKPGASKTIPIADYGKARSIAKSLTDAYQDRKWILSKKGEVITVACVGND